MALATFHNLVAWQKAMELVLEIYKATFTFPKEELYGLTSQLRRAGVSVPSNIAQGQGRNSPREFVQFLSVAYGSLCEIETQLLIANQLHYLPDDLLTQLVNRVNEVGRLLNGLSQSISRKLDS